MSYTYEQLSKMTVNELRQIADGTQHEAVKGALTMHKEKLLPALCTALGIAAHEHHDVKGLDKSAVKMQIKQLKAKRAKALEGKDYGEFKQTIRKIHDLKRALRKAMV